MFLSFWSRATRTAASIALCAATIGACGSNPSAPAPGNRAQAVLRTDLVSDPGSGACNTAADCPVPEGPCVLCPGGVSSTCPEATCIVGQCGTAQSGCPDPLPCGSDGMPCPPGSKCRIEACTDSVGVLDDDGGPSFPNCWGVCVKSSGGVGDPCGPSLASSPDCNPGLLCCYPCGVAGCDNVCTVPIDGQCPQFF